MKFITEDDVRDKLKEIVECNVGQQTTFNVLGFTKKDINKINDNQIINPLNCKPDGWAIDEDLNFCLVAEVKNSNCDLNDQTIDQLMKYIKIAKTKYKNVIGIAYNGVDFKVFKNFEELKDQKVLNCVNYYKNIFRDKDLDKNNIYLNTKTINDLLHFEFGINDLSSRMVLTSCILVAKSFGATFTTFDNINQIKLKTIETLQMHFQKRGYYKENTKLSYLIERLQLIVINKESDNNNIADFLDAIDNISDSINSSKWKGEDVMAIFFNEFTRYKGKSENGQVFTPEHIASLMYKIANISYKNKVLDACCGSGTFLVKSMSYMLDEVGGNDSKYANDIKQNRLYGIENDKTVFSLACANMLIHKDGKSNIEYYDSRSTEAGDWIKSKYIDKVLMNPPYENKYKPFEIIKNVLDNVKPNSDCLFLLPNNKLRVNKKIALKLLKTHSLTHIIKLPNIFEGMASAGEISIFWFKSGIPQNDNKIIGYHIPEDGLQTIKNQGRHDINGLWDNVFEPYWVEAIKTGEDKKYNSKKIIDPNEYLEYPEDYKEQELFKEDFEKVVLNRILFENPDIANKLEKKSKNNPNGLTQDDWIIHTLKIMENL